MQNNENRTHLIELTLAWGMGSRQVSPSDIRSLVSLSRFHTDVRIGPEPDNVITVEHSIRDVLRLSEEAGYPFFKSWRGVSEDVKIVKNLEFYRELNQ
jgi:hypothetical protein